MKYLSFSVAFFWLFLSSFQVGDIRSNISRALKNGDSKSISSNFSSSINLVINREENMTSKFQAELILQDFFNQNKISDVKVISGNTQNSSNKYLIYEVQTAKKSRRILIKLIEIKGSSYISEFRIE